MATDQSEVRAPPVPELTPEIYARWRASELGAQTERLERRLMLGLIGDVSGKSVLEVGCGDGEFAVALAKLGARVTAIDGSGRMINAAKARADKEGVAIQFSIGDASSLPYGDEQFDVVVAVTILCFVKFSDPVFCEIARVLKAGGHLAIGELGKWSSWAIERRVRAVMGSALWKRGVFRTPAELKRLATQAGLVPDVLESAVYYPRWCWAARLLAPVDQRLGRLTPIGAAFLGLRATKPD